MCLYSNFKHDAVSPRLSSLSAFKLDNINLTAKCNSSFETSLCHFQGQWNATAMFPFIQHKHMKSLIMCIIFKSNSVIIKHTCFEHINAIFCHTCNDLYAYTYTFKFSLDIYQRYCMTHTYSMEQIVSSMYIEHVVMFLDVVHIINAYNKQKYICFFVWQCYKNDYGIKLR